LIGYTSKKDKGKTPILEHFHTPRSMGNALAWGDQQTPEPINEVDDIKSIAYDRKIQVLVRITSRKRNLTLDSAMVITIEENLLDSKNAKLHELLGEGMTISHATIEKDKEDEMEVDAMRRELETIRHQDDYYKDTTQAIIF
jgi:hypothetical protein